MLDHIKASIAGEVTIHGKKLKATGRLMKHYREIEKRIVKQRMQLADFLGNAAEGMRNDILMFEALSRSVVHNARTWNRVTYAEFGEWLMSPDGTVCAIWLITRDCNAMPGTDGEPLTLQYVEDLCFEELQESLMSGGKAQMDKKYKDMQNQVDDVMKEDRDELKNSSPPVAVEPGTVPSE